MPNENQDKINKLSTFAKNPELANFEEFQQINDSLETIASKPVPTEVVHRIELQGLMGPQGPAGESIVGPQGPEGKASTVPGPKGDKGDQGEPGVDGIDGKDGVNGKDGKNGSPDTAGEVRDKLESLKDDDRLDVSAIKGFDQTIADLKSTNKNVRVVGGGAKHSTKFFKLTPDGSTKIFSVPKSVTAIILMSDFPHILFEGAANGFTINGGRTQITLTTDTAPSVGSQLLFQYSEVFNTL